MELLKGHISPETAYLVEDYPYSFRLRCKIRYWLEVNKAHGVRMCSQTTDARHGNVKWNQPKRSTYCRFAGAMYLDNQGHVQWAGLGEYSDAKLVREWIETYGEANVIPEKTAAWLKAKEAYEAARERGKGMTEAAAEAAMEATLELASIETGIPLPPEGVVVVALDDAGVVHNTIAQAVGEAPLYPKTDNDEYPG